MRQIEVEKTFVAGTNEVDSEPCLIQLQLLPALTLEQELKSTELLR